MGLTLSKVSQFHVGNKTAIIVDATFDSAYPTGGESLTPADVGLGSIEVCPGAVASGYLIEYDRTNKLLKAYAPGGQAAHTHNLRIMGGQAAAGATQVLYTPAATDVLGKEEAGDALVLGADEATKGGVVATAATVAAASEVGLGTNLSTVTARLLLIGV